MKKIVILTTGGTLDKVYFDAKSEYEVGPPNISVVLGEMKLAVDYTVTSLFKKDSLEISDSDREILLRAVVQTPEKRILITHGTDTMVDTALHLAQVEGKTIVLTGAMEPALFKTSDAVFNIGCAIAAVQILPPGVYIGMNGALFSHDNVRKNVREKIFEEIRSS